MLCLQMGFGWTNGAVLFLLDRFGWHPSTEALA
jgi:neutral trehalase